MAFTASGRQLKISVLGKEIEEQVQACVLFVSSLSLESRRYSKHSM
jgi:hypothetical protein